MHRSTYQVTERGDEPRRILKTALVYHDRKTTVPKEVLEYLRVTAGRDRVVWVLEGGSVLVESATQKQ